MSRLRLLRGIAVAAVSFGAVGAADPAAAQSFLSTRGLGFAEAALDARARALGGVGLGLPGAGLSLVNPASIAGLPAPALGVTLQTDHADATLAGGSGSGSTTRFPMLQAALPLGSRWALSLGYGAFLDQNWRGEVIDSIAIGTDQRIAVRDQRVSDGGVASFQLGTAYSVSEALSVGVAALVHTGTAQTASTRSFAEAALDPSVFSDRWGYSGLGLSAGVRWTASEALSLAAAVTGSGSLSVERLDDGSDRGGAGLERSYDLPLRVSAGAAGRVSSGTLVALSGDWAGWSAASEGLTEGAARDTWSAGAGVEWEGLSLAGRMVPLRLGARTRTLPFAVSGGDSAEWPDERAVTGGAGIVLGGGAARVDLSGELGSRAGGAFSEDYWRLGFTFTVFGR